LVTAKAKTKAKTVTKVAKGATTKAPKAKTVSKAAPKTQKKAPPKPAAKSVAKKPATKPSTKPASKPAAKAPAKPAAKPVPKAPVAKPAPKTIATPQASVASKAPAKAVTNKPVNTVPDTPVKHQLAKPSTEKIGGGLSEAEVIKQSKTDYMSRQQLAFFKVRLLELQNELRENAGATTEHLRELAVAPDPADRATLEEEHALELRTRDRERKLLKKVQSALMRIEDGSYGYCEETGEPIGIQRLLARPTATLTIEAQERREMKQKMYGE